MKIKDQILNKLILDSLDSLKKLGIKEEEIEFIYIMVKGAYMSGYKDATVDLAEMLADIGKGKITREQAREKMLSKFEKE